MKWVQIWSLRRLRRREMGLDIVPREMMISINTLISNLNRLVGEGLPLPQGKTLGRKAKNEKQIQSALKAPLVSFDRNETGDSGTLRARRSLADLINQSLRVLDTEPGTGGEWASPAWQRCGCLLPSATYSVTTGPDSSPRSIKKGDGCHLQASTKKIFHMPSGLSLFPHPTKWTAAKVRNKHIEWRHRCAVAVKLPWHIQGHMWISRPIQE